MYQNPFIVWFNHNHEPSYDGETFETPDGAIVVGGGLASIDVVKVLSLENAVKKLTDRGIIEKGHIFSPSHGQPAIPCG